MCRWFAYISNTEACLLEDVLIVPQHALTKQVHDHYLPKLQEHEPDATEKDTEAEIAMRNRLFNADGFGVAWYTNTRAEFGECEGPRPVVYHILSQPLNDPVFTSVCANASSRVVFAHVRAASPGSVITIYNNHPFIFGRWSFMHNGGISDFPAIRREMLAEMSEIAASHITGTTDSEHLAMLFFSKLAALVQIHGPDVFEHTHPIETVKLALEQAISAVIKIQKAVLPGKGIAYEASSLNLAVTDGTQLLAVRFRNHATEHPPSLYMSTVAGVTLNRKYPGHPNGAGLGRSAAVADTGAHGAHVIVASEPTTYDESEWDLIPKNHCVVVKADMTWSVVPVEVEF